MRHLKRHLNHSQTQTDTALGRQIRPSIARPGRPLDTMYSTVLVLRYNPKRHSAWVSSALTCSISSTRHFHLSGCQVTSALDVIPLRPPLRRLRLSGASAVNQRSSSAHRHDQSASPMPVADTNRHSNGPAIAMKPPLELTSGLLPTHIARRIYSSASDDR